MNQVHNIAKNARIDPAIVSREIGAVVQTISQCLARLESSLANLDQQSKSNSSVSHSPVHERQVNALIRQRGRRAGIFGDGLFADPGWDILLALFAAHLGQRREYLGSLANVASSPATTVLRWVSALEARDLLIITPDRLDGRRRFVELTEQGVQAMYNYFSKDKATTLAA